MEQSYKEQNASDAMDDRVKESETKKKVCELIGMNGERWMILDPFENIMAVIENDLPIFCCPCKINWTDIEKIYELLGSERAVVYNAIDEANGMM